MLNCELWILNFELVEVAVLRLRSLRLRSGGALEDRDDEESFIKKMR